MSVFGKDFIPFRWDLVFCHFILRSCIVLSEGKFTTVTVSRQSVFGHGTFFIKLIDLCYNLLEIFNLAAW